MTDSERKTAARLRAQDRGEKWDYTALFYCAVGDKEQASFCWKVSDYFYDMSLKFV